MSMKKKIISILMLLAIVLSMGPTLVYANEDLTNNLRITEEEAKYLAVSCIWDIKEADTNLFESDFYYSHVIEMYDSEMNVSAYVVNFEDKEGNANGYVIVSATNEYPEIIEFSDEGCSPYEELMIDQIETSSNEVLIYEGNVEPLSSKDLENNTKKESNFKNAREQYDSNKVREIKKKGQLVKEMYIASGGDSTIGEGDFIITNPSSYEVNVYYSQYRDISGYNITYSKASDFAGYSNHCGPVAATNIMRYWWNKDSSKYSGLKVNGSWNDTFVALYNNMYYFGTTNILSFVSGATSFTRYNSSEITFKYYSTSESTLTKMKIEIQAGRPFVILVQDHGAYGDHYVVGLGYYTFLYSNGDESNYIRIADGWISSPSRYIYYNSNVEMYLITATPE